MADETEYPPPLKRKRGRPRKLAVMIKEEKPKLVHPPGWQPKDNLIQKGRKGSPKHLSHLLTKEGKDARAMAFMMERVGGKTISQVAKTYECHPVTVVRYLQYAAANQLVSSHARSQILNKLVPIALAVVEKHLTEGNLEAAQDVLFGLGILQKQSNIKHEASSETAENLESFRAQYLAAKASAIVVKPEEPIRYEPTDEQRRGSPFVPDRSVEDEPE